MSNYTIEAVAHLQAASRQGKITFYSWLHLYESHSEYSFNLSHLSHDFELTTSKYFDSLSESVLEGQNLETKIIHPPSHKERGSLDRNHTSHYSAPLHPHQLPPLRRLPIIETTAAPACPLCPLSPPPPPQQPATISSRHTRANFHQPHWKQNWEMQVEIGPGSRRALEGRESGPSALHRA